MEYIGTIIRPPSEASSIILQVTVGCSHNKCTFCGAYKDKTFTLKSDVQIGRDIDFAAQHCRRQSRLFLADGDALIIPFTRLRRIFKEIRCKLPWVRRISLYGNARSIRGKTMGELAELKRLGLDRLYMGLESGCDVILEEIRKGETARSMVQSARKVREVGIFLSVTTLLGLGQMDNSRRHALETAATLNLMQPRQVAVLTLIPLDNTELGQKVVGGGFVLPGPDDMLRELRLLVENLKCSCQIQANHASNYIPISGRLPKDKPRILREIDETLSGVREVVPEYLRSL